MRCVEGIPMLASWWWGLLVVVMSESSQVWGSMQVSVVCCTNAYLLRTLALNKEHEKEVSTAMAMYLFFGFISYVSMFASVSVAGPIGTTTLL